MTTHEHLTALAEYYRRADVANDVEGRVRAAEALHLYTATLKRTDTARAWIAFDNRRKERP